MPRASERRNGDRRAPHTQGYSRRAGQLPHLVDRLPAQAGIHRTTLRLASEPCPQPCTRRDTPAHVRD